jgi:hypothetical protein
MGVMTRTIAILSLRGAPQGRRSDPGAARVALDCFAALAMTIAVTLLASGAKAQDYTPAPPIQPADMINYCVYGGLIYSVGSQICIMKGSPPLYCDQPAGPAQPAGVPRPRAQWTTSQPPATINCNNDPVGPSRPYR